ncbi:MAG: hypothetical protein QOF06_1441 [Solirubrobacterales bacterium]|jgi:hypothetical protein|nr:hypothetical protein [Solirubrobacterales bacterium]MEA2330318.1 hypothetical protein [Thermoleophilaceae bacterium]
MLDRKRLGIYLNDHLGGSTTGVELAKRIRGANEGNEYGVVLARVAQEIEEDRQALERLMDTFEIKRDHPKVIAGWVAEKVGRLKLNGQLIGYSPLSRLVELEGLAIGITGKLSLWEALLEVADEDPRLDRAELTRLSERADSQRAEVWRLRQRAAREAFVAKAPVA